MQGMAAVRIIQALAELGFAGAQIASYVDEARANNGELSDASIKEIEGEVKKANELWEGR